MSEVFYLPKIVNSSLAAAIALCFTLAIAGCKQQQPADVVATVNGHPILRSEMDKAYDKQLGESPQQEKPSQEQADSLRPGTAAPVDR